MARNTLIIVGFAILALFTVFFLKSKEAIEISANRATSRYRGSDTPLAPHEARPKTRARDELPPVNGMVTNQEAVKRDLAREVQELEKNLVQKQDLIRQKTERYNQLQSQTTESGRTRGTAYTAEIDGRSEQLENLRATLEEIRAAREDLRAQEDTEVRVRANQAQGALLEIDTEIQRREDAYRQVEQQWYEWSRRSGTVNGAPARNENLENQLAGLKGEIDSLRSLRLSMATEHRVATDSVYSQSQQARDDLRQQEQAVRTEMFSLQSEIRRIQRAQLQDRSGRQTSTTQLRQLETELRADAEQAGALERTLQQRRADLQKSKP